jgi:hypothetical protein
MQPMHWRGSCSLPLLVLTLSACGDDAPGAVDSTGSGTSTGPGTTGSETAVPDETATPDPTAGEDDSSTGGQPGDPCVRNDDCEDDNPCAEDVCNSGVCELGDAVISGECRPTIDVEYPPRAATLQDDSPVVSVVGSVSSGAGPITSLRINDEDVTVAADGTFTHDVTADVGGNILVIEAVDALEVTRKRVQSFLWSPSYRLPTTPETGIAEEGLAIWLDQETLDDGSHTLPVDDVATLLGLGLSSYDIEQFINPGTPIASSAGYNIYLTTIQYADTDVTLDGIDGGIELQGFLYDIAGDLVFDCTIPACALAGGDGTGDMVIDHIQVSSDLLLSVNANNQLVVDSVNTQTNVVGLDITSNNIWTNFLITVAEPFILGGVVADIEADLTAQVDALIGPALSQAFNGLSPNTVLQFPNIADAGMPIEVELVTDFSSTDFHDGIAPPAGSPPQGGVIVMRGGGYAQAPVASYENLGIPDRAGCGAGGALEMPRDGALEIGLSDDLLNQLLHGAWSGGLLEFDMPPELLPADGFISDLQIHVSGMLAPTASDCSADGMVRAHLGDVRIDGSLMLGQTPVTFVAYSSMFAGLEFTPTASGVAITISEVERIDTELTVAEDAGIDTEPLLESSLEMQLVDGVLGAIASGGLGGIDLPQIDISAMLGLPPGTAELNISTDEAVRAPGVTVIRGHL